jgi:hypothetical protein
MARRHQSPDHSLFIHQSCLVITSEAGEAWREMVVNFACEVSLFIPVELTCSKILRHGADSFTSPLKEVLLRIFITLKNPIVLGWVLSHELWVQ